MSKHQAPDYQDAREIVKTAKADDLAILLTRIGAAPYLYHTPYTNNDGVTVNMWSCISYTHRLMPGRTLLTSPTVVRPEEHENWNVRILTDEWVVSELTKVRHAETIPVEESPFAGGVVGGWTDDD